MQCTQLLKPTTEELALVVEKLSVPLKRLHLDETGCAVVGPEKPKVQTKKKLSDFIDREHCDCWIWTGSRLDNGYGTLKINLKRRLVHRFIYSLIYGNIPEGKLICHHCDNPSCVNPFHLYAGTHLDNCRDMWTRNRHGIIKGEDHVNAVLTDEQVRIIKSTTFNRYPSGRIRRGELKALAAKIGAPKSTVNNILTRGSWSHIETT